MSVIDAVNSPFATYGELTGTDLSGAVRSEYEIRTEYEIRPANPFERFGRNKSAAVS